MKTDKHGGASADENLEKRLASRFEVEVSRAERDYPELGIAGRTAGLGNEAGPGNRPPSRLWPRLIAVPVGLAAVVIAVLALAPLMLPAAAPATHGPVPAASGATMAADGVPAQIDGQRVYRAADSAAFPVSGSFLLGGAVSEPDVLPPCPQRMVVSAAEQSLIPYCFWVAIDDIRLAPMSLDVSDLRGSSVVARVHTHDPLAAQCPAGVRDSCDAAIVVEAIVWSAGPGGSPAASPSKPPYKASFQLGVDFGPDGVPTTIDGAKVLRAGAVPLPVAPGAQFLLGGPLGRDTTCVAPTPWTALYPPGCGFWTVDGVKLGAVAGVLDEALIGRTVVVQVQGTRAIADCLTPCTATPFLYVIQLVWPVGTTSSPVPPPALPTP